MGSALSLGRRPLVHFAPSPAVIQVKADGRAESDRLSFRSFVESRCPTLFAPFAPLWWLFSGHLQTAYCVVGDFSKIDKVVYDRKLLRLLDGGTVGLDFVSPADEEKANIDVPIIVVMHGLTGGSHESYVRCILAPSCDSKSNGGLGYRGVVINFRGCAGTPLTSPQLYSAMHTDDLRQSLMYISQLYPDAPLLGLGFSLGANVLTRYLAEEGTATRLTSACILGCPWDLVANSRQLEKSWFYRTVYSRAMGQNLLTLFKLHKSELAKFPDSLAAQLMSVIENRDKPLLSEFDGTITCAVGGSSPPFPFASAMDYYLNASSHEKLADVRIPCLVISAADDPVVRKLPIDAGDNGLVTFVVTHAGGHLGWFERGETWNQPRRWIIKPVMEWLGATGRELLPKGRGRDVVEIDGWMTEEGKEHLGFRVLDTRDTIVGTKGEGGLLQGL